MRIAIALAVTAACPRIAKAHDPEGMYVPLFLVPAHVLLLPGYGSTLYYGVQSDRPMHPAWAATNLTFAGFLTGVSAWQFITFVDEADQYPANVGLSVGGFAGASVVAVATILQVSRPRQKGSAEIAVLPQFAADGRVSLVIGGQF